jgi:hypothetical protein
VSAANEDTETLDRHVAGLWIQHPVDVGNDSAVATSARQWAQALQQGSSKDSPLTPEMLQAASLRATGSWLTVGARWTDWYAYFVNHNRIHGHKWLTPWADCQGFLGSLASILSQRMKLLK